MRESHSGFTNCNVESSDFAQHSHQRFVLSHNSKSENLSNLLYASSKKKEKFICFTCAIKRTSLLYLCLGAKIWYNVKTQSFCLL